MCSELPPAGDSEEPQSLISVWSVDDAVLDVYLRLTKLLDEPQSIEHLAPLYKRELIYRVMSDPRAGALRKLFTSNSQENRISRVIFYMQNHFKQSMEIEDWANMASMSTATFYRYFKEMTGQSPLQYVKQLQLLEARRLIQDRNYSVSSACYEVGYHSTTQFSREYKRLFGQSPQMDKKNGK